MRIALTGSAGLIGGGMFQLLRSNHEIMRLGRRKECDLHVDFADTRTMSTLNLAGYDVLIHCAGVVDEDFVSEPERAWAQAVSGVEELAKRALAGGVKKIIYFSTTHVYGAFEGRISEDHRSDPLTHYAIAHYATEQILKNYVRKGMGIFIIRPNAVYGMPFDCNTFDRWSLVPFDLPLQAAYQEKIILKSSGEQKRNFIALEDLVRYVEKLLTAPVTGEAFFLNAVGSETVRIVELARMCASIYQELTGRPCPIEKSDGGTGHSSDFQLITLHADFRPSLQIADFLRIFLRHVIDTAKEGVVYGQR